MWRTLSALLFLCASHLVAASADYQSAKRKIALIEEESVPAGSRVTLSARELNAYVRAEAAAAVPEGLRSPKLELGHGSATGFAMVDFLKLRNSRGLSTSWFLSRLLEGERPVRVTARIRSSSGRAVVDVERVEISGIAITGPALDFLIQNFLMPRYPNAKIGEPFELGHRIERLDVEAAGVGVVIGNQ